MNTSYKYLIALTKKRSVTGTDVADTAIPNVTIWLFLSDFGLVQVLALGLRLLGYLTLALQKTAAEFQSDFNLHFNPFKPKMFFL